MRKFIPLGLLAAAIILVGAHQTVAQETHLNSASAEFRAFYAKFIAAVHRGDKTAVAAITSFPLSYGFDTGDEGKWTRSQFLSKGFRRMFGKSPSEFLPTKNPLAERDGNSYTVSTRDATHLVFTKSGKRFLFTDYIVEP